jgi:hypothetical protein
MKTIKRKGITFQIDKEDEDNFIFYITKVKGITDEDFLDRWLEYLTKEQVEDIEWHINDGEFDYIPKIISDIEKLKDKWSEHPEDFKALLKYIVD